MLNFKNIIYVLTCISLFIVIGGGVYEHIAVWPTCLAAPPASLSMVQGEYGLNPGLFWSKIHPLTLLLLIITLILHWKSNKRKNILIAFIGYIILLLATFLYFVPEIIEIANTEFSDTIDEALRSRASLWENLSLLRLLIIFFLGAFLILGLSKNDVVKS